MTIQGQKQWANWVPVFVLPVRRPLVLGYADPCLGAPEGGLRIGLFCVGLLPHIAVYEGKTVSTLGGLHSGRA